MRTFNTGRIVVLLTTACGLLLGCRDERQATFDQQRFQIASASMAPRWLGPHFAATCTTCRGTGSIAFDAYDPLMPSRCFRCGGSCKVASEVVAGDIVELQALAKHDQPRRLDVVVVDRLNPSPGNSLNVKRVWGLPGEKIALRSGELWIDGKLFQKSLSQLAQVAVLLSTYPRDPHRHWWRMSVDSQECFPLEAGDLAEPVGLQVGEHLLFCYHYPNRGMDPPWLKPAHVVDDYVGNQNSTYLLHRVHDLLLAVELLEPTTAAWFIQFKVEDEFYRLQVIPETCSAPSTTPAPQRPDSVCAIRCRNYLRVAVCDGRFLASSDIESWEWDLQKCGASTILPTAESKAQEHGKSMDAQVVLNTTHEIKIAKLSLARDLWLGPRENSQINWSSSETTTAGYFVLGDNLPISIDSRDAGFGRIERSQILGRLTNQSPEEFIEAITGLQKSN